MQSTLGDTVVKQQAKNNTGYGPGKQSNNLKPLDEQNRGERVRLPDADGKKHPGGKTQGRQS